jgi:hypothetical protein
MRATGVPYRAECDKERGAAHAGCYGDVKCLLHNAQGSVW